MNAILGSSDERYWASKGSAEKGLEIEVIVADMERFQKQMDGLGSQGNIPVRARYRRKIPR
jgi:hypothetical protein